MLAEVIARQEIEYLRRLYARATDLIGTGDEQAKSQGLAIYERIFTPDVTIRTTGSDTPYEATGASDWADVVSDALADYVATQHLIGTQIVEIMELDAAQSGSVNSGTGRMESYLQAWHEHQNGNVWVFIGTYEDYVRFTPGIGWQIYAMTLTQVSAETRLLGTL